MKQRIICALVGVCLIIQGCSTTGGARRPPPSATGAKSAHDHRRLDPGQRALADASCYGGLPVDTNPMLGPTELVLRQGYVLEHSDVDKIPLWVCESVAVAQLTGHLARRSRFKADPDLTGSKSSPQDYARSGFDRGHQAPAGNQTNDPLLKDQTFYMSNIAPQRPSMNRGIWKLLEDKTRAWVFRYGHAYEWTGPIRCDPTVQIPSSGQPNCERQTIGTSAVTVPVYFYKIVVVEEQSTLKAIAFVVPNQDFKPPYRLEAYIRSIDWIEQHTGIEFMPNLAARTRRALKAVQATMWP